eukprot:gene10399-2928_t
MTIEEFLDLNLSDIYSLDDIDELIEEKQKIQNKIEKEKKKNETTNSEINESILKEKLENSIELIEKTEDKIDYFNDLNKELKKLQFLKDLQNCVNLRETIEEEIKKIEDNTEKSLKILQKVTLLTKQIEMFPKNFKRCLEMINTQIIDKMKPKIINDLESTLILIDWPKLNLQQTKKETSEKNLTLFSEKCEHLKCLEDLYDELNNTKPEFQTEWLIEVLLKPFKIRFDYHFYGKRDTNRIDKPQFFFIFIMNCLESSVPFLMKCLNESVFESQSFVQGLLQLTTEKMIRFIDKVKSCKTKEYENLFLNLINESIEYEKIFLEYSKNGTGIFDHFGNDEEIMKNWIKLDKKNSQEFFFQNLTNWDLNLNFEISDSENAFLPSNSAFSFMKLIKSLNNRYKYLPVEARVSISNEIQFHFVKLYIKEIKSKSTLHLPNKKLERWEEYCRILNSSIYCESIFRDWTESILEFDFNTIADEFGAISDSMIRHLIKTMMEMLKFEIKNKYNASNEEYISKEIVEISQNLSNQLNCISLNIQKNRFIVLWRKLIFEIDEFFSKEKQLNFQDIEGLIIKVFSSYSTKPLNFIPKTLKRK